MKRSFTIKAIWDEEAKVYYSESDIEGLHIEAETLEEFEEIFKDIAAELVIANHLTVPELATKSMKDLLPTIIWERPSKLAVA